MLKSSAHTSLHDSYHAGTGTAGIKLHFVGSN